jgi:hypothetical protein
MLIGLIVFFNVADVMCLFLVFLSTVVEYMVDTITLS